MTRKEEFRTLKGTNYEISNRGRVKNSTTGHILATYKIPNGYIQATLYIDGKKRNKYIHRLMAECFLPDYSEKLVVNHIDSVRDNNTLDNMEMVTKRENTRHGYNKKSFGTVEVAVIQYSLEDVKLNEFKSQAEASRETGTPLGGIGNCIKGRQKTSGGFKWKAKDANYETVLPESFVVLQHTLDGEFVAEHESITKAAKAVDRSVPSLWNAVNGITNTCAGYKWELK